MDDLISRQAAIKAIDDLPNCYNGYSDTYDKAYIIGVLEELPSVKPKPSPDWNGWENGCGRTYDVQPKKGEWISKNLDNFRKYEVVCSECGARYVGNYDAYDEPSDFNYCPNCGARMERSEE